MCSAEVLARQILLARSTPNQHLQLYAQSAHNHNHKEHTWQSFGQGALEQILARF